MCIRTNTLPGTTTMIPCALAVFCLYGGLCREVPAQTTRRSSVTLKVKLIDRSHRANLAGLTVVIIGERRIDRIETDKHGELEVPIERGRACRLKVNIKVGERAKTLERKVTAADVESGAIAWEVGKYLKHGQCLVTVVDAAAKNPIRGMTVIVKRDNAKGQVGTTNEDGKVAVEWRGKGSYSVTGLLAGCHTVNKTIKEADWQAKQMEWAIEIPRAQVEVLLWVQRVNGKTPLRDGVRLLCCRHDKRGRQISNEPAISRDGKAVFWEGVKGATYSIRVATQQYPNKEHYYFDKPIGCVYSGSPVKMEATLLPQSAWDRNVVVHVGSSDGVPVSEAHVRMVDANGRKSGEVQTGQTGEAILTNVSTGRCVIVVWKNGYGLVRKQVEVPFERLVNVVVKRVYELAVDIVQSAKLVHPNVRVIDSHGESIDVGAPGERGRLKVKGVPQGKYLVLAIGKEGADAGGHILVGNTIAKVPTSVNVDIELRKASKSTIRFTGSVPGGRQVLFVEWKSGHIQMGAAHSGTCEAYLEDGTYDVYLKKERGKYVCVGKRFVSGPGEHTIAMLKKEGEVVGLESVLERVVQQTEGVNSERGDK